VLVVEHVAEIAVDFVLPLANGSANDDANATTPSTTPA
jgi:hypothetical protein